MAQPDPRHLLTADVSGTVRLWDLMAPPDEHTADNKVLGLAATTGDATACVALASGAIGRLDLGTVRFEEVARSGARLVSHAVSQQRLAYIADDLVLVARHGDRAEEHVALPFQPDACGFAADGTLYVVGEHGTLARVPAGRFEPDRVTTWPAPSATRFKYLVVPSGGRGPAALATDGTLVHWPVMEQQPRVLGTHPEATDLIAAAEAAVLYTAGLDGCIRSWPLDGHGQDAGKVVLQWPGQLLTAVALDERGGRLFAGTMLGRLAVFEFDTGELLLELPGHAGGPTDLAFFDQQQILLSSSWNGQIRIHRAQ